MKKQSNFTILPIFLILLFAAFLRMPTFWLSHTNFDEQAYRSLALKLDKFGFKDFTINYSLCHIDIYNIKFDKYKGQFIAPLLSQRKDGNLVIGSRLRYEYKTPNHRPPFFSYLLYLSHKLFASNIPYVTAEQNLKFGEIFSPQFYVAIIPFLASLTFILSVYILGYTLFSEKVGIYAAMFITLTPIDIMVSQKIWAGDVLSLFCTLSMLFYWLSIKNNSLLFAILSGLSAGMAILTKMTGLFIPIAIICFHIWHTRKDWSRFKLKTLFLEKKLIMFGIVTLFISGLWLFIYYTHIVSFKSLGIPKGAPVQSTPWLKLISSRPFYIHIVNIPYQFPIFTLFYFFPLFIFRKKDKWNELFFLFIWYLVVLLILSFLVYGKEGRHMLICYPAIAILSAYSLVRITNFLDQKSFKGSGMIAEIAIISLSAIWAFKLVFPAVVERYNLLIFPF
jgi:4-amino-4-deoxy-L-arabinose transferase-like glycosyltransferase